MKFISTGLRDIFMLRSVLINLPSWRRPNVKCKHSPAATVDILKKSKYQQNFSYLTLNNHFQLHLVQAIKRFLRLLTFNFLLESTVTRQKFPLSSQPFESCKEQMTNLGIKRIGKIADQC